jgi:hypothetical protein
MVMMKKIALLSLSVLALSGLSIAKENIPNPGKTGKQSPVPQLRNLAASCAPASAQTELAVNNVRTRILAGGDMWWDLIDGKYEIPKVTDPNATRRHSLFAGSLWIGGLEDGQQLKVAAMTYRQDGNDFWPGPLDVADASIDDVTCSEYDRHWKITREQVESYAGYLDCLADPDCETSSEYPGYVIPQVILDWPGNRPDGAPEQLAPYFDANSDGQYDPLSGDYPGYDLSGEADCKSADILFGDETLWWVFNDKGNIHTETGAEPIGLEIHAQAFGFATNDEVNNMTFYSYKIINRSTFELQETYFGQWVDPDLGQYQDDYVGCDVDRGLGYVYNGDEDDEGAAGYGLNPPSLGVDFFRGPLADPNDGIDNDRDGVVDEPGEQIIMAKFVYYNNDFTVIGNPEVATHYYNYLRGIWKDNTDIVDNAGNGHQPTGGPGPVTNFMFPGDPVANTGWTELSAGNTPADRRFLQSAGSFTLQPGAVNYITVGVVWARATSGGRVASIDLMRLADDKAQALFDNCFKVLNGPDAPDMDIQELDKQIVLTLSNRPNSNNYLGAYEERDPLIIGFDDTTYVFEGYQIFQLRDPSVSINDIYNTDLARLVAQVDESNGVAELVNYTVDQSIGANVPQLMTLQANDNGISNSFLVTEDLFATGNRTLVNHKRYYYTVVAYAYNNYKEYNQSDPNSLDGQKQPYLAGRRNIQTYSAIPHKIEAEEGGTLQQSEYGDGPEITRLDGKGNGANYLEFTTATVEDIVANYAMDNPVYVGGSGPLKIKVIDPLNVPNDNFTVVFSGASATSTWYAVRQSNNDTVFSETTIGIQNEQLIPDWGLSFEIQEQVNPGQSGSVNNGFIDASIQYEDASRRWLSAIEDIDGNSAFNWIRSGIGSEGSYADYLGIDDDEVYENVLAGTWAPYRLVSANTVTATTPDGSGPAWEKFQALSNIRNLHSVDVVFTANTENWTRVPVIELQDDESLAIGGAKKMNLRESASVDKDGNPDGSGNGWGWFPGYAVDLETGQRVNMMFGEDSWLVGENGADMVWNPTSNVLTDQFPFNFTPIFGGKHYIYVMNSKYEGNNEQDNPYYSLFDNPTDVNKRNIYAECNWVNIPILAQGEELLNNDVRVSLRVTREYENYATTDAPNGGDPMYQFNTSGIATVTQDLVVAENAMQTVRIVPNPYYAYSEYEQNQLDNRVKITNLPERCTISIYSVSGILIKRFQKDSPLTFLEWDLTNQYNIPIASGMYVFHIEAPGVGETYVKWFGAMRPIDLDTF